MLTSVRFYHTVINKVFQRHIGIEFMRTGKNYCSIDEYNNRLDELEGSGAEENTQYINTLGDIAYNSVILPDSHK